MSLRRGITRGAEDYVFVDGLTLAAEAACCGSTEAFFFSILFIFLISKGSISLRASLIEELSKAKSMRADHTPPTPQIGHECCMP